MHDVVTTTRRSGMTKTLTAEVTELVASGPVLVGEYLLSNRQPSVAVARPLPWRSQAVRFAIPDDGAAHLVQIVSATGSSIALDGQSQTPTTRAAGHELLLLELGPGAHQVEGDAPLTVGVASYRSYASTLTRL